ncbi:MAG TPA: hypothetical protein VKB39_06840 [Candidatus Baltobacteraceae bacterium]|nr:hypothetical protein [Candidatus Baltobacteraceae bacterium]
MSNGLKWLLFAGTVAILACSRPSSTAESVAAASTAPATAMPVESIPYVLPAWQYVTLQSSSTCWGADAGQDDPKLWWALETCSTADAIDPRLPQYCNGSCHLYAYVDVALNSCSAATAATFAFNNTKNEGGFLHAAGGPSASSTRLIHQRHGHCGKYGGTQAAEYFQNLGDPAMQSFLYANVWNNPNAREGGIPNGFGVMNDDVNAAYAPNVYKTSEYGGVYLWQKPSGPGAAVQSWYAGLAAYFNSMCPAGGRCVHTSFNGLAGGAHVCAKVDNGDCYGSTQYAQGYLNNAVNVAPLCSALTRNNVDGAISERRLFTGGKWSRMGLIAAQVNTSIAMALGACPGLKYIDLEQPSESPTLRFFMTGLQWLAPDQRTGIPDEVVQWRYATGPANSQVASFWPEYTVVPQGPEQLLTPYRYGGSAPHDALGCPSANGDTGGVVALVVACSGDAPVWGMQYRHCYINRSDVGPCATLVNASPNAVNVTASMFRHDPISTYRWQFVFSGLQMAGVRMGTRTVSTGCAVPQYCDGAVNVNGLPFKGDGSDTIPGLSAIFVHS